MENKVDSGTRLKTVLLMAVASLHQGAGVLEWGCRVSSRGRLGGLKPPTQDLGGGSSPPLIFSDTEISNAS